MSKSTKSLLLSAFFAIIISLFFSSCLGSKSVSEKNSVTKQTEKSVTNNDSVKVTEINKKIDDAVSLLVSKSGTSDEAFNKAVDKAVDDILSKLNISKQSGDNNYQLYYDMVKRELQFKAQMGETKTETTDTNKSSTVEKSFEQTTDEYLSKKISLIPWWVYVIGILYFLPKIIEGVTAVYNPLAVVVAKFKKKPEV